MRIRIFLAVLFLLALVGLFINSFVSPDSKKLFQEVQENFNALLEEQELDLRDFENQFAVYSNPFYIQNDDKFPKRVFVNGELVYWNNNEFIGSYNQIRKDEYNYLYDNEQGLLHVQRKVVSSDKSLVEIFSFVKLSNNPPVKNQYLKEGLNPLIFNQYPIRLTPNGTYSLKWHGEQILSFSFKEESSKWSEIVGLSCLIVLIISGSMLILGIPLVRNLSDRWYLSVFSVLLIISWAITHVWTLGRITHWDVFNPVHFTYTSIFYSLGQATISMVVLFIWSIVIYSRSQSFRPISVSNSAFRTGIVVLVTLTILLLSQAAYSGFWTLLEHSQINLDIAESIQFGELRIIAYLFIVLMGLSVIIGLSLCIRLIYSFQLPRFRLYLIWLTTYILFGVVVGFVGWVAGGAFLLVCLVIDVFGFSKGLRLFRYQTFAYLILLITAFSAVGALAIYKHTEKDDRVAKEKFANRLLIRNDILGELYLHEVIKDIEEDRYVRTRLMSKILSRQNIREKIKRQFLSSYFKRYDIEVYFFDAEGSSLQDNISTSYVEWEERYRKDTFATDYEKIYFIKDQAENFRNKYISFLDIKGYGREVGHIILDLTLKKYIPTSVFPELLLESRYFMGGDEFDYAVYKDGTVMYKQGRFSFENKLSKDDLESEQLYEKGMERNGTHYFGLKTQDGRNIIIISPTYSNQALAANFSFIFLLLVFSYGLFFVFYQLVNDTRQINLSTKIQLYLGLSFIIPMLIVSIALLNTLNSSYREEIDRNFEKRSYNLAENIVDLTEDFISNHINIDEYATSIASAGALAQSDINVYDIRGKLITSSQPEIFRLGLLSNLIDPLAYKSIKYRREQNLISERAIGTLDFKTSYTALRSYSDGRLLGILAMPYFDSKNHLRRQQVEVFSNLISIFTMIFLVSILTGNFIVNHLIRPLRRIGEKLRSTSLEETNQPIQYDTEDEIGSLVKEYNLMLIKLEESKDALARSQKESAWKEIARQVAHEIKNPLTPMRLKIQQMMKTFNTEDKNYKSCRVLIDQIDTLSSIADSFSEFAKMPAPDNQLVDISKLLESVVRLYQSKDVKFSTDLSTKCSDVFIDPKVFNGIFTNIILNAIQATRQGQTPTIAVKIWEETHKVLISIGDDGQGIPEELKENIFTPYFSTKSQGSGIGLAVAKKGIENAGGTIWFESEEGQGTTFFISLPAHNG